MTKDKFIQIRVSEEERERFMEMCEVLGVDLSKLVREALEKEFESVGREPRRAGTGSRKAPEWGGGSSPHSGVETMDCAAPAEMQARPIPTLDAVGVESGGRGKISHPTVNSCKHGYRPDLCKHAECRRKP